MSKRKKEIKKEIKVKSEKTKSKKLNHKHYYITALAFVIIIIFIMSLISTTPKSSVKVDDVQTTTDNPEYKGVDNLDDSNLNINSRENDTLPRLEDANIESKDNELTANYQIDQFSSFEDFKGRPSVILFVGTYCGHCSRMIPEYKTKIWDNYKDSTNLWAQVINDATFEVDEIAQGLNKNLDFNEITNSECGYIPSFVILDKEGEVVLKSCGSEKGLEDISSKLDELLN